MWSENARRMVVRVELPTKFHMRIRRVRGNKERQAQSDGLDT